MNICWCWVNSSLENIYISLIWERFYSMMGSKIFRPLSLHTIPSLSFKENLHIESETTRGLFAELCRFQLMVCVFLSFDAASQSKFFAWVSQ